MTASKTSSPLSATAAEFAPGQTAHPSPAPSEHFSSPSPPLSALKYQSYSQFQPQQYCVQQPYYGNQPYPLFNGYTQAYDFRATPPPYSAQPQGAPWYPEQNGYVGYTFDPSEPFDVQFRELQGVRSGQILSQQGKAAVTKTNTWKNYANGTGINTTFGNGAHKKKGKKNRRKKFNKRQCCVKEQKLEQHPVKEQKLEQQAEIETKVETEPESESKPKTKVVIDVEKQG